MIHLLTGAKLTRGVRPIVVSYGGLTETVEQPGWYPRGKGEAVYDGPDLSVYSEAWQRLADTVHEAAKQPALKPTMIAK
jgi:HTH-type transcriptional regulator/antitoxin MqsA